MRVKLSSKGLDKAIRDIAAYEQRKVAAIQEQVTLTALAIEAEAKINVPVQTGRLRASIQPIFRPDGLGAEVGTNVTYAASVEFGIGRIARPYLFPAAEKERQNFIANIKEIFKSE
jgi:phage gpG-like protein